MFRTIFGNAIGYAIGLVAAVATAFGALAFVDHMTVGLGPGNNPLWVGLLFIAVWGAVGRAAAAILSGNVSRHGHPIVSENESLGTESLSDRLPQQANNQNATNRAHPAESPGAEKSIGRKQGDLFVLSRREVTAVQRNPSRYANVLSATRRRWIPVVGSTDGEFALVLGRGVATAVTVKEHVPLPSMAAYDVQAFTPSDLEFLGEEKFRIHGVGGHFQTDALHAACLRAWASDSGNVSGRTSGAVDGLAFSEALALYAAAKGVDHLSWIRGDWPLPSTKDLFHRAENDEAERKRIMTIYRNAGLQKQLAKHLLAHPNPALRGLTTALVADARQGQRMMTLGWGIAGALGIAVGCWKFNPFVQNSFVGWALVGGGAAIVCGAVAGWLVAGSRWSFSKLDSQWKVRLPEVGPQED